MEAPGLSIVPQVADTGNRGLQAGGGHQFVGPEALRVDRVDLMEAVNSTVSHD